ncbi:MAG: hypothetical protein ACK4IX_05240, partial [Candidatus Sericytochromatia bacterium]
MLLAFNKNKMKNLSTNSTITNIINSRIFSFLFLLSLVFLFVFTSKISYSAEIENKAHTTYK